MMNGKKTIAGLLLSVLPLAAWAVPQEPDGLIRETAQEVLEVVKQDKDIRAGNQKKILDLVESKILPHFDFERMTKLTAGKEWRNATPEQRTSLIAEFRTLLVRTYTNAFIGYQNQTVEVKPVKMQPGDDEVTVRSQIVKQGAQPIQVDYELKKTASEWKVFDLTVEGASLIATYRNTFAQEIQKGGFDGLIRTLADKNAANAREPIRKAESK